MEQSVLTRMMELPARGQITLPIEFRRKLGLSKGALLQISLVGEKIEITRVSTVDTRLREYTDTEIGQFLKEDMIDEETAATVRRLLAEDAL